MNTNLSLNKEDKAEGDGEEKAHMPSAVSQVANRVLPNSVHALKLVEFSKEQTLGLGGGGNSKAAANSNPSPYFHSFMKGPDPTSLSIIFATPTQDSFMQSNRKSNSGPATVY